MQKRMIIKESFITSLRAINREGMENVIEWLETSDFFSAPASRMVHGNHEGGLLEHSIEVCRIAQELYNMLLVRKPELKQQISIESVILASLLHDVCKANIYTKQEKIRTLSDGQIEKYDAYTVDYSEFPLGHGEKSVIRLLQLGLKLTDDEIMAIRWHMSAWNLPFQSAEMKNNFDAATKRCPLLTIVQTADELASSVMGM